MFRDIDNEQVYVLNSLLNSSNSMSKSKRRGVIYNANYAALYCNCLNGTLVSWFIALLHRETAKPIRHRLAERLVSIMLRCVRLGGTITDECDGGVIGTSRRFKIFRASCPNWQVVAFGTSTSLDQYHQ